MFNDEIQQSEVNVGNVGLFNALEARINPATEEKQDSTIAELQVLNSLTPAKYDYISLSYTGGDLTGVVFKTGGQDGDIVSTLALAYSNGNLISVTKI